MPHYAYWCPTCGTFDSAAALADAGSPQPCPRCEVPGSRIYTTPGGRSPRRARELGRMGGGDIRRVERGIEGEPAMGPMPAGRRVTAAGPAPRRPPPRRPWTMGH